MRNAVILPRLLALLAVALAPLLALQAQVNAGGPAPGWALNWNGFRIADLASSQVKASLVDEKLQFEVSSGALKTAQRAYEKEPFATDGLFVIGLQRGKQGKELFQEAQILDQRNRLIGGVLLQQAAEDGDLSAILPIIDRLARLRPALASELVKAFSSSLNDPKSIPFLEQKIRERPPWANAFWRAVPIDEPALGNFFVLRKRTSAGTDLQSDANLITALINAKRYAEAFEFRETLTIPRGKDASTFDAREGPLDWQLTQSRYTQARFDKSGQMDIFVDRGSAGELARKLVRLSTGSLKLLGDVERRQGYGNITAELTCANDQTMDQWRAGSVDEGVTFEIPANSCPYGWLILKGSAWESQQPLRAEIRGLALNGAYASAKRTVQ